MFRKLVKAFTPQPHPDYFSLPPFKYSDNLQGRHIRLLRLEDGEPDAISCTIEQQVLDQGAVYEALSYVWGDQTERWPLIVNGCRFEVGKSLFGALLFLRKLSHLREGARLWVDAICINQSSDIEKTQQVRMMGDVYAQAIRTRIFLGDANDKSMDDLAQTLKLVKEIDEEVIISALKAHANDEQASVDNDENETHIYDYVQSYCARNRLDWGLVWLNIWDFFSAEWFNRIWVIQEFARSREPWVHIGPVVIQWEIIFRMASVIWNSGHWGIAMAPYICHDSMPRPLRLNASAFLTMKADVDREAHLKLYALVLETISFDFTDPRDKIFALVGLSHDTPASFIDYSLPLRDVIINIAKHELTACERGDWAALDFLSSIRHDMDDEDLSLPSWVPNLTKVVFGKTWTFQALGMGFPSYQGPLVRGKIPIAFPVSFGDENQTLHVEGILLDKVKNILDESPYNISTALVSNHEMYGDIVKDMIDWLSQASHLVHSLKSYPTGEDLESVFAKTLGFAASKEDDRNVVPLFNKFAELVKLLPDYRPAAYIKRLGGDPTPEKSARIDKIKKSARNYIQRFDQFSKGRLLCLTEKGHLAWVPQLAVVGDQIYAFRYCRIPFVLREEKNDYRLMGDCYLHGFMRGEPYRLLYEDAKPITIV